MDTYATSSLMRIATGDRLNANEATDHASRVAISRTYEVRTLAKMKTSLASIRCANADRWSDARGVPRPAPARRERALRLVRCRCPGA